jgi:diguanylate cyclase
LNTPSLELGLLHVKLEQTISRAKASQTGLALLVIHLARLKDVHETIGRRAGEVLIANLLERWSNGLGDHDTLVDLGGGEFALLLPGATGEAARGVAEGLLRALERPFEVQGATVELGGSVGIVVYPDHADDADTLLRRGDVAANEATQSQTGYAV